SKPRSMWNACRSGIGFVRTFSQGKPPAMSTEAADSVPASKSSMTDPLGLHEALRHNVRGDVRFDNASRALYATDGSNYRQVPIGVVLPRDADDVAAAISACREFGAPLLCRGGGTSLAGQCCNV